MSKKLLCSTIITMLLLTSFTGVMAKPRQEGKDVSTIRITGKEALKDYLEHNNEPYDPNLVEVVRAISNDATSTQNKTDILESDFLNPSELVIRHKYTTTVTDFGKLLRQYNRPAGKVVVHEQVTVSHEISGNVTGKVKDFLEISVGYVFTDSKEFGVDWENTYSYPISIKVYPIYEETGGEVWEDDLKHDDFITSFRAKKAIGDDVRVYRQ